MRENVLIWISKRPGYCDRGRYLVGTDLPLDSQEGWPRYYFSLLVAKSEIWKWLKGRKEFQDGMIKGELSS